MTSYIIINNDLIMSKGKITSQVAHAILEVHRFLLSNNINHDKWLSNGEKIVVLKSNSKIIENILLEYNEKIPKENIFNIFPIYDAGKTQIKENSLTVIASTPISNDKIPEIIKTLKLF